MHQTWEIGRKTSFEPHLGYFAQIWAIIFLLNSGFISQYQKKTNNPILRKLSVERMDGETERETEGQTDKSDIIGHCLTNVEYPW